MNRARRQRASASQTMSVGLLQRRAQTKVRAFYPVHQASSCAIIVAQSRTVHTSGPLCMLHSATIAIGNGFSGKKLHAQSKMCSHAARFTLRDALTAQISPTSVEKSYGGGVLRIPKLECRGFSSSA